jgi:hypothetical protein
VNGFQGLGKPWMVRVCSITQIFWTQIESDHNEIRNVFQKVNFPKQQS